MLKRIKSITDKNTRNELLKTFKDRTKLPGYREAAFFYNVNKAGNDDGKGARVKKFLNRCEAVLGKMGSFVFVMRVFLIASMGMSIIGMPFLALGSAMFVAIAFAGFYALTLGLAIYRKNHEERRDKKYLKEAPLRECCADQQINFYSKARPALADLLSLKHNSDFIKGFKALTKEKAAPQPTNGLNFASNPKYSPGEQRNLSRNDPIEEDTIDIAPVVAAVNMVPSVTANAPLSVAAEVVPAAEPNTPLEIAATVAEAASSTMAKNLAAVSIFQATTRAGTASDTIATPTYAAATAAQTEIEVQPKLFADAIAQPQTMSEVSLAKTETVNSESAKTEVTPSGFTEAQTLTVFSSIFHASGVCASTLVTAAAYEMVKAQAAINAAATVLIQNSTLNSSPEASYVEEAPTRAPTLVC